MWCISIQYRYASLALGTRWSAGCPPHACCGNRLSRSLTASRANDTLSLQSACGSIYTRATIVDGGWRKSSASQSVNLGSNSAAASKRSSSAVPIVGSTEASFPNLATRFMSRDFRESRSEDDHPRGRSNSMLDVRRSVGLPMYTEHQQLDQPLRNQPLIVASLFIGNSTALHAITVITLIDWLPYCDPAGCWKWYVFIETYSYWQ